MWYKSLTVWFFAMGIFLFHSCTPGASQRHVLSLSRATSDLIENDRMVYCTNFLFFTSTKTCPHCGKLVEFERSEGECMFRELMTMDLKRSDALKMFLKTRKQLRAEAENGHAGANILLGKITEKGLFCARDIITAARHYRLAADSGEAVGRAALGAFWVRIGENLPAAVKLLNQAIREMPRKTEPYLALSEAYAQMGRRPESFTTLKTALGIAPVQSRERTRIEKTLIRRIFDSAREIGLERALREIDDLTYLSPENTDLPLLRADLYILFGKIAEAEKTYTAQLIKHPDDSRFLLRRAELCLRTGDANGAHRDLNHLLKKYPDESFRRFVRVLTDFLNREKGLNPGLPGNLDSASAIFTRGALAETRKDFESALSNYEKAQKLLPDYDFSEFIRHVKAQIHSEPNSGLLLN